MLRLGSLSLLKACLLIILQDYLSRWYFEPIFLVAKIFERHFFMVEAQSFVFRDHLVSYSLNAPKEDFFVIHCFKTKALPFACVDRHSLILLIWLSSSESFLLFHFH